jgi:hypothetical protein
MSGSLEFINRPVADLGVREASEKPVTYPTRKEWEEYLGIVTATQNRAMSEGRSIIMQIQVDSPNEE